MAAETESATSHQLWPVELFTVESEAVRRWRHCSAHVISVHSAVVVFPATSHANSVFCVSCNPHSANPSKYEGNLNQKPLDFHAAPVLWCQVLSFTGITPQMVK